MYREVVNHTPATHSDHVDEARQGDDASPPPPDASAMPADDWRNAPMQEADRSTLLPHEQQLQKQHDAGGEGRDNDDATTEKHVASISPEDRAVWCVLRVHVCIALHRHASLRIRHKHVHMPSHSYVLYTHSV